MRVMITGGCGYIGSNIAKLLLERGEQVLLVDDMSNAKPGHLSALARASGGRVAMFSKVDLLDASSLALATREFEPQWVIHCAGVKSVRESKLDPLKYWRVNVGATSTLIASLPRDCQVLFSSSATVYASKDEPVGELEALEPTNAYGASKLACEWMLRDAVAAGLLARAVALRYFNPLGADSSGELGDDPLGEAENVMPMLIKAAMSGKFSIFGSDYPTRDGTAIRDYIHIEDLAKAHLALMDAPAWEPWDVFNVGSSRGSTVSELLAAFKAASGSRIEAAMSPRRHGDAPFSVADCAKIKSATSWRPAGSLEQMCASAMAAQGRRGRCEGSVGARPALKSGV